MSLEVLRSAKSIVLMNPFNDNKHIFTNENISEYSKFANNISVRTQMYNSGAHEGGIYTLHVNFYIESDEHVKSVKNDTFLVKLISVNKSSGENFPASIEYVLWCNRYPLGQHSKLHLV